MAIAGILCEGADGSNPAFAMQTTESGPDIVAYHDRQSVVLRPTNWAYWIYPTKTEDELLRLLPEGSLAVETVRKGSD